MSLARVAAISNGVALASAPTVTVDTEPVCPETPEMGPLWVAQWFDRFDIRMWRLATRPSRPFG
jgi:hypothetical protein